MTGLHCIFPASQTNEDLIELAMQMNGNCEHLNLNGSIQEVHVSTRSLTYASLRFRQWNCFEKTGN